MIQRTLAAKDHNANKENWKGKRELKNRFNFGLDEHELPVNSSKRKNNPKELNLKVWS